MTYDRPYEGGDITTSALVEEGVQSEAETFADARELFAVDDRETSLWKQFTDTLECFESVYPSATITSRMQTTAESGSVPTKETVNTRLADATEHRIDELSTQCRRITGITTDASDPDEICADLTDWVRENESAVKTLCSDATDIFNGVSFDTLESVLETAWNGTQIDEGELVAPTVHQQAETYEKVRDILDGDPSPWSKLESVGNSLREDHPESPTTEAVGTVLGASRPPSLQRVRQLIENANDPRGPGANDDVWSDLQRVAEELRQELPNADVTDRVTSVVDTDDRPTEEKANELLSKAKTVLDRIDSVRETLDNLEDDSIVLIESSPSND